MLLYLSTGSVYTVFGIVFISGKIIYHKYAKNEESKKIQNSIFTKI